MQKSQSSKNWSRIQLSKKSLDSTQRTSPEIRGVDVIPVHP